MIVKRLAILPNKYICANSLPLPSVHIIYEIQNLFMLYIQCICKAEVTWAQPRPLPPVNLTMLLELPWVEFTKHSKMVCINTVKMFAQTEGPSLYIERTKGQWVHVQDDYMSTSSLTIMGPQCHAHYRISKLLHNNGQPGSAKIEFPLIAFHLFACDTNRRK